MMPSNTFSIDLCLTLLWLILFVYMKNKVPGIENKYLYNTNIEFSQTSIQFIISLCY